MFTKQLKSHQLCTKLYENDAIQQSTKKWVNASEFALLISILMKPLINHLKGRAQWLLCRLLCHRAHFSVFFFFWTQFVDLHCCDKSENEQCRTTCRKILRSNSSSQEVVMDTLIEGGCGHPLLHVSIRHWQFTSPFH